MAVHGREVVEKTVRACNAHDDLVAALVEIDEMTTALRHGGPAKEDLEVLSFTLARAIEIAGAALAKAGAL